MKKGLQVLTIIVLALCALAGCDRSKVEYAPPPSTASTSAADSLQPKPPAKWPDLDSLPVVTYRKVALTDAKEFAAFRRKYAKGDSTMKNYRALTTVNRKDIQYFHKGDTVIIPDTILEDLRAYSVFPKYYPGASNLPKLIVISNPLQAYACYDSGRLVRFAATNTGTERKPTFPGRYALNWRQRVRHSSLDSSWVLPYTWNFHLNAGSALHQFVMPGRPVSHSCARQFMDDAAWLFKWGKGAERDSNKRMIPMTGTPVIILGMFDYTRKNGGPWREITSNTEAIITLPDDPMAVEEALIPISQIPKDARGSLVNYKRYLTAEDTLRARGVIREGVRLSESIDYNKLRRQKRAAQRAARQPRTSTEDNGVN